MSQKIEVNQDNFIMVVSIWIFMCWGDPDLWDALIHFLMRSGTAQ